MLQRDVVAVEECSEISLRTHVEVRLEQIDGESVNVELPPTSALDTRAARDDEILSGLGNVAVMSEWSDS